MFSLICSLCALRRSASFSCAGHIFAVVPLGVQRLLDLAGGIPQVHIVHDKLERGHQVIFLGVEVAAGSKVADAVFGEIPLRVVAGFRQ